MRATLAQGLLLLHLVASAWPFGRFCQPAVPYSSIRPAQDIVLLKLELVVGTTTVLKDDVELSLPTSAVI